MATLGADPSQSEERADLVARAADALGGPIDILVNNAAAAIYVPLVDYRQDKVRLTFEVNVVAPMDLAQQAVPGMRQAGEGWIVNVSSSTAQLRSGPPFQLAPPGTAMAVYGASKAALNRLTNGLAIELVESGIRVNTVEPKVGVLTEGADRLVGDVVATEAFESMEQMVEAAAALCGVPATVTGRVCVSLDVLEELRLDVRALDARPIAGQGGARIGPGERMP